MGNFDDQYIALCEKILIEGETVQSRYPIPTRKIFGWTARFNLAEEFPILTSKYVGWKTAILEMLWIYQQQSNDVRWLQDRGIKIWNEWQADSNGDYVVEKQGINKKLGKEFAHTIGTAYGWIVKKYGLIDKLRETLRSTPNDRRMVVSLWQDEFVPTATLPSCVWSTTWCVVKGKLNLTVNQRAADVPLGLPFNITQYAMLAHLIARDVGLEVGEMMWCLTEAWISENQIEGIKQQIKGYKETGKHPAPKVWINPEVTDFYAIDSSKELKDIRLDDYKYNMKINMPIQI